MCEESFCGITKSMSKTRDMTDNIVLDGYGESITIV